MFEFFSVPRVVFGIGVASTLTNHLSPLGNCVLVVFNGTPQPPTTVLESLAGKGVRAVPHRQQGEPTVADVDSALAAAREAACTGVVGVGGGSAIDLAKAVAGLLGNGGSVLDYMEVIGRGQKITRPASPWIAIPTTAGTGAEVTRNAVIGDPTRQFKASLRSEQLLPTTVIVDPALGQLVPPETTAASGMDALCQCIESFTSTGANDLTDGLALKGIELAARALPRAVADGTDLNARRDMAMSALISGIALTNAGLGAVHGFAAPLGANFAAPHGAICAALLAPVLRANIAALQSADAHHPLLAKYAIIGRLLSGHADLPAADALLACAQAAGELTARLGIRPLSAYGLAEADVPTMVALAQKASSMRFNPVVLPAEVLQQVLREGIAGM